MAIVIALAKSGLSILHGQKQHISCPTQRGHFSHLMMIMSACFVRLNIIVVAEAASPWLPSPYHSYVANGRPILVKR